MNAEASQILFDRSKYASTPELLQNTVVETTLQGMEQAVALMADFEAQVGKYARPLAELDLTDELAHYEELDALPAEVKAWRDEQFVPAVREAVSAGMEYGSQAAFAELGIMLDRNLDPLHARDMLVSFTDGDHRSNINGRLERRREALLRQMPVRSHRYKDHELLLTGRPVLRETVPFRIAIAPNEDQYMDDLLATMYNADTTNADNVQLLYDRMQLLMGLLPAPVDAANANMDELLIAYKTGLALQVARAYAGSVFYGGYNAEYAERYDLARKHGDLWATGS